MADGGSVWVRLVGGFAVLRDGSVLRGADIGSRKARTLLAVLAVHGRYQVSLDRIVEALWTGRFPRRPAANVATLVSRLRAGLGAGVVAGGGPGYRIGAGVRIDLHDAAALASAAEAELSAGAPEGALAAAHRAVGLLDDVIVASEADWAWAEPAALLQGQVLRRARHAAAEAAVRAGEPRDALAIATGAIRTDPLDEAAYRLFMRACDLSGEPARALVAYQTLRTALARRLGVDPSPPTRELHSQILRCNAATEDRTHPVPAAGLSR